MDEEHSKVSKNIQRNSIIKSHGLIKQILTECRRLVNLKNLFNFSYGNLIGK